MLYAWRFCGRKFGQKGKKHYFCGGKFRQKGKKHYFCGGKKFAMSLMIN